MGCYHDTGNTECLLVHNFTGYNYVGCYRDTSNADGLLIHDFTGYVGELPALTIEFCVHICWTTGYKFVGLMARKFCACDNNYGGKKNEIYQQEKLRSWSFTFFLRTNYYFK